MKNIEITKHVLVPKHIKLSKEEKEALLKKYNFSDAELPKILITDPAISSLNPKEGDIIKIIRRSPTAKESVYYRVVVNV